VGLHALDHQLPGRLGADAVHASGRRRRRRAFRGSARHAPDCSLRHGSDRATGPRMTEAWSVLIAVHAVCASYALLFGAVQLSRRKGDRPHRVLGWIWVSAMAVALITSFGIVTISGTFGILHALSLFTAGTVTIGVVQARRRRIRSHRAFMIGSYLGLVGAFVGVLLGSRRFRLVGSLCVRSDVRSWRRRRPRRVTSVPAR
jgi:uncharacterized membrane protein